MVVRSFAPQPSPLSCLFIHPDQMMAQHALGKSLVIGTACTPTSHEAALWWVGNSLAAAQW